MNEKLDSLVFWVVMPPIMAGVVLIMVPFMLHHLLWRHVLQRKDRSLFEIMTADDWDMDESVRDV